MYPRAYLYLSVMLGLSFVAFWPTYLSRLGEAHWQHHFHGTTAGLWMLLLVSQTWLAKEGKFPLHRQLGKSLYVLAPLFVLAGLLVVHRMVSADDPFNQAFGDRLAFFNLTSLAWFVGAVVLAIHYRRQTALHSRLMLSTVVALILPVFGRLIGMFMEQTPEGFIVAIHGSFVIAEVALVLLLLDDRRQGKVRAPFACALGLTVIQHVLFMPIGDNPAWTGLMRWYAGLPLGG